MATTDNAFARGEGEGGERCLDCGRTYRPPSRPRWAFDKEGHYVGTVHTYHGNVAGKQYPYITVAIDPDDSLESAQFRAWKWHLKDQPTYRTPEWYAYFLADVETGPAITEGLNTRQTERLKWWIESSHILSEDQIPVVLDRYRALVREFHAWRAALARPAQAVGE